MVGLRSKKMTLTQQRRKKRIPGQDAVCARTLWWNRTVGAGSSMLPASSQGKAWGTDV